MTSLLAKDAYLQGLAKKICSQPSAEPQKRKSAGKTQVSEAAVPPREKRKKAQKKSREREKKTAKPKAQAPAEKSEARKPEAAEEEKEEEEAARSTRAPADGLATEPDSSFALDVLRQLLHEKIEEARGQNFVSERGIALQGSVKELSAAVLEKRRRRKQERDRKKRKRRELRAKEKAAAALEAAKATEPGPQVPGAETQAQLGLIFNKVEVTEEEPASKAQRRKEKRQKLKGNLTPLTGRNYRQLLERLQARQARLEELRDRDAGQAQELEDKMRWTNLLYKAEGVRIRDNERLLQEALKRKERRRAQRLRAWEKRTAHVVGKMQQRQDRRRQNLHKKKVARAKRRLEKARKKGRILPQDLERAGLA